MCFKAVRLKHKHSYRSLQPNWKKRLNLAGCICMVTWFGPVLLLSCCFWENQPKSPSCCFIFTIKSKGLACRVPSAETKLPTFHFTTWQFFSWIIPPCKTLQRTRHMDYLIIRLLRNNEAVQPFLLIKCQEATSYGCTESPDQQLCPGESIFWNKSSLWLFPYFYARLSTTHVSGYIFLIFWCIYLWDRNITRTRFTNWVTNKANQHIQLARYIS